MTVENPRMGFECQLYVNNIEVQLAKDVKWKRTRKAAARTCRAHKGCEVYKYGMLDWECSGEMICDPTNSAWLAMKAAWLNRTTVALRSVGASGGVTCDVLVTDFSDSEPLNDVCNTSFTMVPAAAIVAAL